MTTRGSKPDKEENSKEATLAQYKEFTERAQLAAHFSHSCHDLFSGIENGLSKLKDSQPFDQKSLALIEMLIKSCRRGNELAAQMLAASRVPGFGLTDGET